MSRDLSALAKKTFNVERLTTPVAFSGIKLGMFKENNKIQVYEQG